MTTWGYARVSTLDQDLTPQIEALRAAGVRDEHLVVDHASGARQDRPGLTRLTEQLEAGDVLTVWKLDRLGRSLSHLVATIDEFGRRGVQFRSLTEALDTTTPAGRLLFHVVAACAEFERELTVERTRAALATARASGKPLGRPSRVTKHQWRLIQHMRAAGYPQADIAKSTGLSRSAVGRVLRDEISSLARYTMGERDAHLPLYQGAGTAGTRRGKEVTP